MLKKIPQNLSPELVKVLMEMGHGDEIVIADGNFPAASIGRRVVRGDGQTVPELLQAILELFPLDTYSESQVILMEVVPGDTYEPEIWPVFERVLEESGEPFKIEQIDRFAFYERAKEAYAVVTSSEMALYANIILKKGVVK